jgi:hypothetical protein
MVGTFSLFGGNRIAWACLRHLSPDQLRSDDIANRARLDAHPSPAGTRAAPKIDPALRAARTCYDHIAGRLGVALADSLVTRGAILLGDGAGEVTADGQDFLRAFGVPEKAPRGSRRLYCRACLDWSERRTHLSGVLGAALLARCEELGWVVRALDSRALMVTKLGERGFARTFNVQI